VVLANLTMPFAPKTLTTPLVPTHLATTLISEKHIYASFSKYLAMLLDTTNLATPLVPKNRFLLIFH
jgi:hypothetical protein